MSAYWSLIVAEPAISAPAVTPLRFDFTTDANSALATGFTAIKYADVYNSGLGYGWYEQPNSGVFDRMAGGYLPPTSLSADAVKLVRDCAVMSSPRSSFRIGNLAPGTLRDVRVYLSDLYNGWPGYVSVHGVNTIQVNPNLGTNMTTWVANNSGNGAPVGTVLISSVAADASGFITVGYQQTSGNAAWMGIEFGGVGQLPASLV